MSKFIPVGGTFYLGGKTYKVIKASGCAGCCGDHLSDCNMFPKCNEDVREDATDVIFVNVNKKAPKDLVSTEDLQALRLTYEQLAMIYAMSYRCNDYGALYNALQNLLDPDGEVWAEMNGLDSAWDTRYLDFKYHFLSLLFPEAMKENAARIQELEEQMHKIQEEIYSLKK